MNITDTSDDSDNGKDEGKQSAKRKRASPDAGKKLIIIAVEKTMASLTTAAQIKNTSKPIKKLVRELNALMTQLNKIKKKELAEETIKPRKETWRTEPPSTKSQGTQSEKESDEKQTSKGKHTEPREVSTQTTGGLEEHVILAEIEEKVGGSIEDLKALMAITWPKRAYRVTKRDEKRGKLENGWDTVHIMDMNQERCGVETSRLRPKHADPDEIRSKLEGEDIVTVMNTTEIWDREGKTAVTAYEYFMKMEVEENKVKPNLKIEDTFKSFEKLREIIRSTKTKKLAVDLSSLENNWKDIEKLIEFVFAKTDIEIKLLTNTRQENNETYQANTNDPR